MTSAALHGELIGEGLNLRTVEGKEREELTRQGEQGGRKGRARTEVVARGGVYSK